LVAFAFGGCDESATKAETLIPVEDMAMAVPDMMAATPDAVVIEDMAMPPEDMAMETTAPASCCIMIPAGGVTSYELQIGGSVSPGVVVFSRETGEPLENQTIAWSMVATGMAGDATLSALETVTDATGTASVEVLGRTMPSTYTLTATHAEAGTIEFDLTVVQLPTGTFQVNVINANARQLEVTPFEVYLYSAADVTCRRIDPLNLPPNPLATQTATMDGEQLSFEVLSDADYAFVGVGRGPNGNIVAQACIENQTVAPEATQVVDLIFQLIPLNPVGSYNVRSLFNFGDALAATGSVGQFIVTIFDGFNNPGQLIYDQVFNLCGQILPSLACEAVRGLGNLSGIATQIQNAINNAVLSTSFGCTIVRAGCDLRDTVRNLEVISTVFISRQGSDFQLFGSTTFTGLAVRWSGSRYELSSDELLNLQLLSGDWQGSVVGYDDILIQSHAVDLNYGNLIVFLIEDLILPALTNGMANHFNDAFAH